MCFLKKLILLSYLMPFVGLQLDGMRSLFKLGARVKTLSSMRQQSYEFAKSRVAQTVALRPSLTPVNHQKHSLFKNPTRFFTTQAKKNKKYQSSYRHMTRVSAGLTAVCLGYTVAKADNSASKSTFPLVAEAPSQSWFSSWYSEPSLHTLLHDSLENFGLGAKCEKQAKKNADMIIQYLNAHEVATQQEEIIDAFAQCFTLQGLDIERTLIGPLLNQSKLNPQSHNRVVQILSQAMTRSLSDVHQDLINLLFRHSSPEQIKQTSKAFAHAAAPLIATLAPRVIRFIALNDQEAAVILAQAAATHYELVNKTCIHTIPMLAKMNASTQKILAPFFDPNAIVDDYLLTEHSGSGGVCASCKGFCKFKSDHDQENFVKLLEGRRVMCEGSCSNPYNDYWITWPLRIRAYRPGSPKIYCTENAWFVPEGEINAKLHKLCMEGWQKNTLGCNDYTRAKTLGYKDEDIEFFYVRMQKLYSYPEQRGRDAFKKDKEQGDIWLANTKSQLDTMKDWHPRKLI